MSLTTVMLLLWRSLFGRSRVSAWWCENVDPLGVSTYHYKRAANQDWTLSHLISKRIQPLLADYEVTCIGGDGCEVHGRTLLRTVRTSYGG